MEKRKPIKRVRFSSRIFDHYRGYIAWGLPNDIGWPYKWFRRYNCLPLWGERDKRRFRVKEEVLLP